MNTEYIITDALTDEFIHNSNIDEAYKFLERCMRHMGRFNRTSLTSFMRNENVNHHPKDLYRKYEEDGKNKIIPSTRNIDIFFTRARSGRVPNFNLLYRVYIPPPPPSPSIESVPIQEDLLIDNEELENERHIHIHIHIHIHR